MEINRRQNAHGDAARSLADAGDLGQIAARIDLDDLGATRHHDPVMRQAAQAPVERGAQHARTDMGDDLSALNRSADGAISLKETSDRSVKIAIMGISRRIAQHGS
ncbi:hypothetical protein [Allochromatium tepidum]|uniref:Uncharacterized protein n=1 Tax=Allochromatium tepidum TaxID=553982 RepID=A0ABM7QL03_9GAMM|nr:hypothetical protein [Allochromatium tepidum]BCU06415.1 hypothetical protein Atep_10920 [Allochromatium tepidum]